MQWYKFGQSVYVELMNRIILIQPITVMTTGVILHATSSYLHQALGPNGFKVTYNQEEDLGTFKASTRIRLHM